MRKSKSGVIILAVFLAIWLALALCTPVLAAERDGDGAAGETEMQVELEEEASVPKLVTEPQADPALSSFTDINVDGFGQIYNRYAWSMVNFKGKIYVGTWNLASSLGLFQLILGYFFPGFLNGVSYGTEVWRYDVGYFGRSWTRVVDDGLGDRDNFGLRTMVVWDDPDDVPDLGPAIYGTTINSVDGFEVWRTFDGTNWEVVVGRGAAMGNGMGYGAANESGRGMVAMGDYLYIGAMRAQGGQLWRTTNGTDWEYVTSVQDLESAIWFYSFGSISLSDMRLFDDDSDGVEELFIGTWRWFGFSVYRYDPSDDSWSRVAEYGITSFNNGGVHQLVPFNGRLWILTYNFGEGFYVYASDPQNPAEGITSNADWKVVASGGFNDPGNYYAWDGIVYPLGENGEEFPESRLFIGTFNLGKGFCVYSVTKDNEWAVEVGTGSSVPNGITSSRNYGVRTFALYDGKLVLGCAGMLKGLDMFLAE